MLAYFFRDRSLSGTPRRLVDTIHVRLYEALQSVLMWMTVVVAVAKRNYRNLGPDCLKELRCAGVVPSVVMNAEYVYV